MGGNDKHMINQIEACIRTLILEFKRGFQFRFRLLFVARTEAGNVRKALFMSRLLTAQGQLDLEGGLARDGFDPNDGEADANLASFAEYLLDALSLISKVGESDQGNASRRAHGQAQSGQDDLEGTALGNRLGCQDQLGKRAPRQWQNTCFKTVI